MTFKPRSYEEIYQDTLLLVRANHIDMVAPGSPFETMLKIIVRNSHELQCVMYAMLEQINQHTHNSGVGPTSLPLMVDTTTLPTVSAQSFTIVNKCTNGWKISPDGQYMNLEPVKSILPAEHSGSKKCDCGSEKVGSPRHSTWCSKYEA